MHLLAALAWCTDCSWEYEGQNAMGLAAIHHKKKGHRTLVELHYFQQFGTKSEKVKELDGTNL